MYFRPIALLVLAAFFYFPQADATTYRSLFIADRYHNGTQGLQRLAEQLATLEGLKEGDQVSLSPSTPLLADSGNDFLSTLRRNILASDKDANLRVDIIIDSHGSPTAIHSQHCPPVEHSQFSREFAKLLEDFRKGGFSPERLSFRIFANYCRAGAFAQHLPEILPFETLVLASTSSSGVALSPSLLNAVRQSYRLLLAAHESGMRLCSSCNHNQELYLTFQFLGRYGFDLGDDKRTARPTAQLFGSRGFEPDEHVSELAFNLIRTYQRSQIWTDTGKHFIDALETIYALDDVPALHLAVRGLSNRFDETETIARRLLEIASRLDDHSAEEAAADLRRFGAHPDSIIRATVNRLLMKYSNIFVGGIDLVHERMNQELGLEQPDSMEVFKLKYHASNAHSRVRTCEQNWKGSPGADSID